MSLSTCPECQHQVSDRAAACPACGFPLSVSANPYQSPKSAAVPDGKYRRPYFQYGLLLGAFPIATAGIVTFLQSRGLRFSEDVLGFSMALFMLPAAGLLGWAALDRFVLQRGLPAAKLPFDLRLAFVVLVAGGVWILIAMSLAPQGAR